MQNFQTQGHCTTYCSMGAEFSVYRIDCNCNMSSAWSLHLLLRLHRYLRQHLVSFTCAPWDDKYSLAGPHLSPRGGRVHLQDFLLHTWYIMYWAHAYVHCTNLVQGYQCNYIYDSTYRSALRYLGQTSVYKRSTDISATDQSTLLL
jgi:hypothetical protein